MKIISYCEARSSLKFVLDTVYEDADATITSGRDGADTVVIPGVKIVVASGFQRVIHTASEI